MNKHGRNELERMEHRKWKKGGSKETREQGWKEHGPWKERKSMEHAWKEEQGRREKTWKE